MQCRLGSFSPRRALTLCTCLHRTPLGPPHSLGHSHKCTSESSLPLISCQLEGARSGSPLHALDPSCHSEEEVVALTATIEVVLLSLFCLIFYLSFCPSFVLTVLLLSNYLLFFCLVTSFGFESFFCFFMLELYFYFLSFCSCLFYNLCFFFYSYRFLSDTS